MCKSFFNPSDRVATDSKSVGKLFSQSIRLVPFYWGLSNLLNLIRCQFCCITSNFCSHILRIVTHRSQKQMIWINASWCVAMMKYSHTVWNWAIMNRPRKAVGVLLSSRVATSKQPVSVVIDTSLPKPTPMPSVGLKYFLPKSFDWISHFWHECNVSQMAAEINAPFIRG